MQRFDKERLLKLVRDSVADNDLRAQALEDVRPYLAAFDRERYVLRAESDLDKKGLIAAASAATDWDVTGVAAMSLEDPFPRPAWLSPHAYERSKGDIIGESFYVRFSRLSKNSIDDIALVSETRTALYEAVQRALCNRLKDAAERSFHDLLSNDVDVNIGQDLKYCGCDILYRYLCFASAGEKKEAERLGKLVRKYAKSPILGLLKNASRHEGVLLVLCA